MRSRRRLNQETVDEVKGLEGRLSALCHLIFAVYDPVNYRVTHQVTWRRVPGGQVQVSVHFHLYACRSYGQVDSWLVHGVPGSAKDSAHDLEVKVMGRAGDLPRHRYEKAIADLAKVQKDITNYEAHIVTLRARATALRTTVTELQREVEASAAV